MKAPSLMSYEEVKEAMRIDIFASIKECFPDLKINEKDLIIDFEKEECTINGLPSEYKPILKRIKWLISNNKLLKYKKTQRN